MSLNESAASVVIRPFEKEDIAKAHALSSAFGWPQRIEDWKWFGAFGRGFVATHNDVVVGTTLHWDYGPSTSSVGAVMVDPTLQGFGIGRRLTTACLETLSGRTIILHATEAGRPLYEKLGFTGRGVVTQHQGMIKGGAPVAPTHAGRIVPLTPDLAEAAMRLAEDGSGLKRAGLMASLLALSEGAILFDHDMPSGLALFRRYCSGWTIGPVVASSEGAAQALVSYWLRRNVGKFVRIDVTDQASEGFHAWLNATGVQTVSLATPMVRGAWPESHAPSRQFAIVTQATG